MKANLNQIKINLAVILGIVLVINLFLISDLNNKTKNKVEEIKELTRPVDLKLVVIEDKNCKDCFDLTPVIDSIKNSNTNILREETRDIKEAKELIEKYSIEKIPTIILSGEIDRIKFSDFEEKENILLFNKQKPAYVDAVSGDIVGLVDLTMLEDKSCKECYDVIIHKGILNRFGVVVDNENTVDITDGEGKKLIEKYEIKAVPTIILSKDAINYPALIQVWKQVGSIEKDGTFVFREMEAMSGSVYKDLTTNKIVK